MAPPSTRYSPCLRPPSILFFCPSYSFLSILFFRSSLSFLAVFFWVGRALPQRHFVGVGLFASRGLSPVYTCELYCWRLAHSPESQKVSRDLSQQLPLSPFFILSSKPLKQKGG